MNQSTCKGTQLTLSKMVLKDIRVHSFQTLVFGGYNQIYWKKCDGVCKIQ